MSGDLQLASAAAENALLSCMINQRLGASIVATSGLTRSDYAWEANAVIHDAIMRVFDRGEAVDKTVLLAELESAGHLTLVGGESVITQIADSPHDAHLIQSYLHVVRDRSVRRGVMHAFERGTQQLLREPDTKQALENVQAELFRSIDSYMGSSFNGVNAADLRNVFELARGTSEYIRFPYEGMNTRVRGRSRGTLTIWGGYSSDGKSIMGLTCTVQACRDGHKAALFCLEMTQEQMTMRLVSYLTGIDTTTLETGDFDMERQALVDAAFDEMSRWNLTMYCDPGMTVTDIRNAQLRERYDYICIDYLQRFDFSDFKEVPRMAKQLKNLALSTKAVIDLLSQINPGEARVGENPFTRPTNNSLYGGRATTHEADNIVFIFAERAFVDGTWGRTGRGWIICTKFRGSQSEWEIPMRFNGPRVTWEEAA